MPKGNRTKEQRTQRESRNRAIIRDFKNRLCMDCGILYPFFIIHLDHREPEFKHRRFIKLLNFGLAVLMAELAKCDVVCANCHGIRGYTQKHHLYRRGELILDQQGTLWDSQ